MWGVSLAASVLPVALWTLIAGSPSVWAGVLSAIVAVLLVATYAATLVIPRSLTPQAPRVAAAIMGASSIVAAVWCMIADSSDMGLRRGVDTWFAVTGVGLAALLLACFAFEMARRERARLIESLSTTAMAGVVAWCAGGWVFLTNLVDAGVLFFIISLVVIVLFTFLVHCAISRGTGGMVFDAPDVRDAHDAEVLAKERGDGSSLPLTAEIRKIASSEGVLSVILAGGLIPLLALVESAIF